MYKEQIKEKDFEINNLQQKNKLVIEENEILKEQIKNYSFEIKKKMKK